MRTFLTKALFLGGLFLMTSAENCDNKSSAEIAGEYVLKYGDKAFIALCPTCDHSHVWSNPAKRERITSCDRHETVITDEGVPTVVAKECYKVTVHCTVSGCTNTASTWEWL